MVVFIIISYIFIAICIIISVNIQHKKKKRNNDIDKTSSNRSFDNTMSKKIHSNNVQLLDRPCYPIVPEIPINKTIEREADHLDNSNDYDYNERNRPDVIYFAIVGTSFRSSIAQDCANCIRIGDKVILKKDHHNRYDDFAVRVFTVYDVCIS